MIIEYARVNDIKFELLKDKKKGRCVFIVEYKNAKEKMPTKIKFIASIFSAWIDTQSMNMVRCWMVMPRNSRILLELLKYKCELSCVESSFTITGNKKILRYGLANGNYTCTGEDWSTTTWFDNKVMLIKKLIDSASKFCQVAGFGVANLLKIPDSAVTKYGFATVADYFGLGPPMWIATDIDRTIAGDEYINRQVKNIRFINSMRKYLGDKKADDK